jgi:hypothetical protein
MQASRTYFRRRETNEVNETGPREGPLTPHELNGPEAVIAARPSGLTRQPATGVRRSVIQAFWVARLKVDPNQLRAFRWSPCRLFLSVVSRPNRKRISVRVSLFLPLRLRF